MQSKAKTVTEYLKELPKERREAIGVVRRAIKENLPKGYEEMMGYGMICYVVPLTTYPAGYLDKSDQPLPYAALASQKNYMAVYLDIYSDKASERWFREEYKKTGLRMDIGKSCVRFRKIEDLPVGLVGKAVARTPVKAYIKQYEAGRNGRKK